MTLPQAQNEAEIATLNGVIERLRQSIEELAAAAQVAGVYKKRDWRSSSHEPGYPCVMQELNGLRAALSEKTV